MIDQLKWIIVVKLLPRFDQITGILGHNPFSLIHSLQVKGLKLVVASFRTSALS